MHTDHNLLARSSPRRRPRRREPTAHSVPSVPGRVLVPPSLAPGSKNLEENLEEKELWKVLCEDLFDDRAMGQVSWGS